MNPLPPHIAHLINAQDCHLIARGGTWNDMHTPTTVPGGASTDLRYTSTPKVITIERSPSGPGKVTWAEVADFIRSGLTEELSGELAAAVADWGRFNKGATDLTYSGCVGRFRELERQVVANATATAAPAEVQMVLELAPTPQEN